MTAWRKANTPRKRREILGEQLHKQNPLTNKREGFEASKRRRPDEKKVSMERPKGMQTMP